MYFDMVFHSPFPSILAETTQKARQKMARNHRQPSPPLVVTGQFFQFSPDGLGQPFGGAAETLDRCNGFFTIKRDNTENPLTVKVAIGGTASNGNDYARLTTSYTFAQGQDTLLIPVNVLNDTIAELPESVTLTILDNAVSGIRTGHPGTDVSRIFRIQASPALFLSLFAIERNAK